MIAIDLTLQSAVDQTVKRTQDWPLLAAIEVHSAVEAERVVEVLVELAIAGPIAGIIVMVAIAASQALGLS